MGRPETGHSTEVLQVKEGAGLKPRCPLISLAAALGSFSGVLLGCGTPRKAALHLPVAHSCLAQNPAHQHSVTASQYITVVQIGPRHSGARWHPCQLQVQAPDLPKELSPGGQPAADCGPPALRRRAGSPPRHSSDILSALQKRRLLALHPLVARVQIDATSLEDDLAIM